MDEKTPITVFEIFDGLVYRFGLSKVPLSELRYITFDRRGCHAGFLLGIPPSLRLPRRSATSGRPVGRSMPVLGRLLWRLVFPLRLLVKTT
jgi:hypothetical protein